MHQSDLETYHLTHHRMFLRSKVTIVVLLALFLGLVITAFNIWQLAELQRQHYEESARVRGGGVAAGTGLAYSLYAKHPDSGLVQHDFMVIPFLGLDNQFDFILIWYVKVI